MDANCDSPSTRPAHTQSKGNSGMALRPYDSKRFDAFDLPAHCQAQSPDHNQPMESDGAKHLKTCA